jgi:hypothetical protein
LAWFVFTAKVVHFAGRHNFLWAFFRFAVKLPGIYCVKQSELNLTTLKFIMRRLLFTALLAVVSLSMTAQSRSIKGRISDKETKEALSQIAIQLLRPDSTFVTGTVSADNGAFQLKAPENGKYLLKLSSVGYATDVKNIVIADDHDLNMGEIRMVTDAIMLKGVTATARALKVTMVKDTFVYNSAAYNPPEGSVVEELVKLLPGASVDDDGNVTINGKTVNKIKMDGKEFMTGDTKTALKNLPVSIVEKVKAYREKSDRERITGIADGNEDMTLDFTIKQGMNKGILGNVDAGYGTHDRYAERLMLGMFKSDFRMMSFGNFNNVNDAGFGGRGGGGGRGRNGLNTSNMVGVNFNYENTGVLKMDGSVRWNHNTANQLTRNSSESFVIGNQSFSNSLSQSYSKNKSWNAQMRLEWTPDTMTNIMFRPEFSWSDNDGRSGSGSATFDSDPYEHTVDPLNEIDVMNEMGLAKNSRTGSSLSYGNSRRVNGWVQYNRKFNNRGRNLTIRATGNYSTSDNKNFSTSNVKLYQVADQDYSINRYNVTPSKNWSYSVDLGYSEPIAEKTYLQLSYKFNHSYSKSDRATYDFSDLTQLSPDYVNLLTSLGINSIPVYRSWGTYLNEDYENYEDESLSRFTEYRNDNHEVEIQFRRVRDNYNFNVGVFVQPQRTNFIQRYLGYRTDTTRNVINVTPTLDFRYYFSKEHQLRFNYRGSTSQPSIADMVQITDDTDPMNISIGNPGLKPSFTNKFDINYNNFIQSHYQVIAVNGGFRTVSNQTAQKVIYNSETGARTTMRDNVNGNWSANINGNYNIAIDTLALWNVSTDVGYSYSNNVGLASTDVNANSQKNITRVHNISDRLALSFRNDWLNVEADGQMNYTSSKNLLNPDANLDTWSFSYGANVNVRFPWNMAIATDAHVRSRRGYSDKSLNTNEFIWNAQISQSFLKAKNLSVILQFYDILHNQSNFSRTINEMMRRDTEYNAINSYAMLHVVYRFNLMGGKDAREHMGPPDDRRGPRDGRRGGRDRGDRGPGGFPPPGGFGGPR